MHVLNRGWLACLGVAGMLTFSSCALLAAPVAPGYTQGSATIEQLSIPGIDFPTEPLALTLGSFISDPSEQVMGGARAVFGKPGDWQVYLERFGKGSGPGQLTIRAPSDPDGSISGVTGQVGTGCRADVTEASAAGLVGTISCEDMTGSIAGKSSGISAKVSFQALP